MFIVSNAGRQVVILGIVTGLLIIFYYSLTFSHWRKNRGRQLTTSHFIPNVQRKSYGRLNKQVNSTDRIVTWVTIIATLVLGTIAVCIKWSIFKGIHNVMVDKFTHNQSLFYNRPSVCRVIYMREEFNMFTFPVACLLIFIFIVTTKRKSAKPDDRCNGYLAVPMPLDFFANINRTFAALTFVIVANELSNFANLFINENAASVQDGIIVNYLLQIVRVLVIGFRCYPILAAVYINKRFTLICAMLYSWLDFGLTVAFEGVCRNAFYSNNDNYNRTGGGGAKSYFKYYGTGSKLVFFQILPEIPRYFFLGYIAVQLPIFFVQRLKARQSQVKRLTREQDNLLHASLPDAMETKYVENLFGLTEKVVSRNPIVRYLRTIYEWRDDFRFSTRVICAYAAIFYLLFFLTIQVSILNHRKPSSLIQFRQLFNFLHLLLH